MNKLKSCIAIANMKSIGQEECLLVVSEMGAGCFVAMKIKERRESIRQQIINTSFVTIKLNYKEILYNCGQPFVRDDGGKFIGHSELNLKAFVKKRKAQEGC